MTRPMRVAVIGGGIGGLTAARALLRRGFEVRIYEAAPELKEIGAGVALGPNAMKALRSLDLEQAVRITILGDAAHPMLPYLGQGACQAMEDGCVLANALVLLPDNVCGALQLYERVRLPRARRVVLTSRARGEDNHLVSRWATLKRDALIAPRRRFGIDPTGRGAAWIFDYDAGSPGVLAA